MQRKLRELSVLALIFGILAGCSSTPPEETSEVAGSAVPGTENSDLPELAPADPGAVDAAASTPAPAAPEAPAIASDPDLIETDEAGDYSLRSDHLSWQVVDPDPNGLNCRMGEYGELEIFEGAPPTPESAPREVVLDIGNWPPVGTLPTGQQFQTRLNLGGWFNVYDVNNKPWIFVAESDGPTGCFVRANRDFVQPMP